MTIIVFSTGAEFTLGTFDAGWTGQAVEATPTVWRPVVAPQRRVYSQPPVKQMVWEER